MSDETDAGGRPASKRGLPFGLFIGLAIGVVLSVLAVRFSVGEPKAHALRSSETLVASVRSMARLETASMKLQKVVDLKDRQSRFWGTIQVTDAVLLIASADVRAGVDLALLTSDDIVVNEADSSVSIRLPKAQIFSVALNSEETYVYSRKTDALATHNAGLETKARGLAEQMLRTSANNSDITRLAAGNAEHVLRTLALSLGFSAVEFRSPGQKPPG